MKTGNLKNVYLINILIAALISLFAIFPDIVLLNDQHPHPMNDNTAPMELRLENDASRQFLPPPSRPPSETAAHPGPGRRNSTLFHLFPHDATNWIFVNYIFFFVLSNLLLFINTYILLQNGKKRDRKTGLSLSITGTIVACLLFIVLFSFIDRRNFIFPFDGMNVFKVFFIGSVSFLFVFVMYLINQQQKMLLENEQLKTENLLTQYNMLAAQINPHFFFNSLNSLSSLVREGENEKSLRYIHELSDIFRYVLRSDKQGLTTLKEELEFLQAYRYMMEIRYEGKLKLDIRVDAKLLSHQIPMFSTQLLLENVIKHNEISNEKPLKVDIYTTDDYMLVISNRIQKKINAEINPGVGLRNLSNRYQLLVNKDIIIDSDHDTFSAKLPLTNPPSKS